MAEIIFINGRVIDPATRLDSVRHVAVRDGRVLELSELPFNEARVGRADELVDAKGLWLVPGLVDLRARFGEPGREDAETIASGLASAVAGGFTTVVAMPGTHPVNDMPSVTELMLAKAKEAGLARLYPAGALTRGMRGEALSDFEALVTAGCAALAEDDRPLMNAGLLRLALERARAFKIPIVVHEDDVQLAAGGVVNEGAAARLSLPPISPAAEESMLARDLAILERTGGRMHVAHVSTATSVRMLREAKQRGLAVTAEVSPAYFTLTEAAVEPTAVSTKLKPPLRTERDRAALVQGLVDGTIDAIASDHRPCSPAEKGEDMSTATFGAVGLETALPLTLELFRKGTLTASRVIALLSSGPAAAFGLPGGCVAAGAPADLTLIDPNEEWTCEPEQLRSKSRNTPFAGWHLTGRAKMTMVEGRIVYRQSSG